MRAVVTIWNKVRSRLGTGGTVSTVAHVLILGSTLVWFSAAPLKVSEEEFDPDRHHFRHAALEAHRRH